MPGTFQLSNYQRSNLLVLYEYSPMHHPEIRATRPVYSHKSKGSEAASSFPQATRVVVRSPPGRKLLNYGFVTKTRMTMFARRVFLVGRTTAKDAQFFYSTPGVCNNGIINVTYLTVRPLGANSKVPLWVKQVTSRLKKLVPIYS
jgi:hypothetical protein